MATVVKRPAPLPRWFWFASLLGCTPGFKKSRCKKLLKVTMSRIKLLRGRREVQVRQLRRDVAQLLQLGQDENAENRLDRLWKEHSLLSAYIKIGEFCQFVKANLRNIAGQRECPMDLKESLASLCFAASCCADLPELQEIRDIMIMKYGSTFLTSAHELLPGEHVNRLFLDAFSTKHPLEVSKKALLKSVVAEYNVVQPKKLGGALQKVASSDCKTSQKQQSTLECGSNTKSCKQDPKLNALEQEEKHKNTPKQICHSPCMPTSGAHTEEHASLPRVEGVCDRKMARQHKKEQKDFQFQEDRVQGGMNEIDQGSQKRRIFLHDRGGKEKVKNRMKASKKSDRVSQAEQTDQHMSSNRMSFFEKSGPDEAGNKVLHGQHAYGNTHDDDKRSFSEVQGSVIGQHVLQENVDLYGHAKHRESEPSNQEEAKQQVLIAQSLKHGYHGEALSEDCIANQMFQQGNFTHKKHDPVEREVLTRSNGKVRSAWARHAFDNAEQGEELCHMDPHHAETKSKHRSRSNKKDRLTNEFDNEQLEKLPRRRNHHAERETRVDVHRIDKSLRLGEMDFGIDYWQSPIIGNGVLPEKREPPPHADPNYGETRCKHKRRSNGTPRPGRATNEQVRSPCKRNLHAEGEIIRFENPGLGEDAYEMKNRQASPKGNGSLPDYGDDTFKVQKENGYFLNESHEIASTMASSVKHPHAHMLQRGRKQHTTKYHYEGPQQETWTDYNKSMVPERVTNMSPSSYIRADDMRYDSKYRARHREENLHQTENCPTVATIETVWDRDEARQNGSILEPCMDDELLPGDRGHVRQKHKRSAKKHLSDLEKSIRQKQERIAEEAENVETHRLHYINGPHVPENDSNNVAQRERERLPQWHNQFDPMPKGCEGSIAAETRALPQVNTSNGLRKEQKEPESLHEDLVAKRSSCERVDSNSSPNRFSKPPQRPPPPLPPYKVSSMPNRRPLNSPPAMPKRSVTLETSHVRASQEPHVHPKLPEYEDLVASFAALRNKPARPPMY